MGWEKKIGAKKAIYQIFELKKKVRAEGKKVTSRAEPSRAENTSARAMATYQQV